MGAGRRPRLRGGNPKLVYPLSGVGFELRFGNGASLRCIDNEPNGSRQCAPHFTRHKDAPVRLAAHPEIAQPCIPRLQHIHRLPQPPKGARHIRQETAQNLGHGVARTAVLDHLHAQVILARVQGVGNLPAETVPDAFVDAERRVVEESSRLVARAAEMEPVAPTQLRRRFKGTPVVAGSFVGAGNAIIFPRAGHADEHLPTKCAELPLVEGLHRRASPQKWRACR
jgi:hypothetical protein